MDIDWRPANAVEREMVAALDASDTLRYVELLQSAPLYLPHWSAAAEAALDRSPAQSSEVVAFTSPVSLFWTVGGLASKYDETTLTALRVRWSDARRQLVVNPGLPIGVALTFGELDDLAAGKQLLLPAQDVQDWLVEEAIVAVRQGCLAALGGDEDTASRCLYDGPVTSLEAQLKDAVAGEDFDAFLRALLGGTIVVPTERPVEDPASLAGAQYRWLSLTDQQVMVLAVFSSVAALRRIAPDVRHWVEVPVTELVLDWPDEQRVLCFNPGTGTELTLPGAAVTELLADLAGAADQAAQAVIERPDVPAFDGAVVPDMITDNGSRDAP